MKEAFRGTKRKNNVCTVCLREEEEKDSAELREREGGEMADQEPPTTPNLERHQSVVSAATHCSCTHTIHPPLVGSVAPTHAALAD